MTDDDVRRWCAEWVGWVLREMFCDDFLIIDEGNCTRSDADLRLRSRDDVRLHLGLRADYYGGDVSSTLETNSGDFSDTIVSPTTRGDMPKARARRRWRRH